MFTDLDVWTPTVFDELITSYIDAPDSSASSYYDKLNRQLAGTSDRAKWLAVELHWLLYLFPRGLIGAATKLKNLESICRNAGLVLPKQHWLLGLDVLSGIGSAGTFFNTGLWFELSYAMLVMREFAKLDRAEREALSQPGANLSAWFDALNLPDKLPAGETLNPLNRQARHILLFLLQPEGYERIASSAHKRQIVKSIAPQIGMSADISSPTVIDEQLLKIRRHFEEKLGTTELDFYQSPLQEMWRVSKPAMRQELAAYGDGEPDDDIESEDSAPSEQRGFPRNVIFYGPPGTGKTWHVMQELCDGGLYSEPLVLEPEAVRLARVAGSLGWYEVIAAALIEVGKAIKVPELRKHPFIEAKLASGAAVKDVRALLWGMLQLHTHPGSATVNVNPDRRVEPFVFDKDDQSRWGIVSNWEQIDPDLREVHQRFWQTESDAQTVRRYKFVTFHPSYAYEDFVEGLRPVIVEKEDGSSEIQILPRDGALKQICKEALTDPDHRYALVVDEINRGNIAKIFGELITLIEPDKRLKRGADGRPDYRPGTAVVLPTSQEWFGVPENVDFFGTMNTADRSIALVDIALRRRFIFREVLSNPEVIGGSDTAGNIESDDGLGPIDLRQLLRVLNARLTVLRGRDTCIGHAYFLPIANVADLRVVFRDRIIPLLQEHFYEDWAGIAQVLAVSKGAQPFIEMAQPRIDTLFHSQAADTPELFDRPLWRVASALRANSAEVDAFPAASFRALYEGVPLDAVGPV